MEKRLDMTAFRHCASRIFLSFPAALFFFFLAVLITVFRMEVAGVLLFVILLSFLFVCCDDINVTTFPFLLLCTFSLKCYDSFDTFIVYLPLGVIPILAFVFHMVRNKRRFCIGKSFWGIVAVAIAVTAGGAFSITLEEYFSFSSLFYIAGLGVGMILAYLVMKRAFVASDSYAIVERLFAVFYMAGCFGVVMFFSHIALEFRQIRESGFYIQWSNNLSTMMMFFMPAPFYFALTRHRAHYWAGILFYLTIALTGSRGGFLMGGAELLLCLLALSFRDKLLRRASLLTVIFAAFLFSFFYGTIIDYFKISQDAGLISGEEARAHLIPAAIRDFLACPVFGRGIGYRGNQNIYLPVKGAANWYHMMIPQIIGSFGTVGILAYGYQFYGRMRLIVTKRTWCKIVLGLSYSGIFLMSQVNPGEFCPIPYELLTVLLFVFLELPDEELTGVKKGAFVVLSVRKT